jgi:protein disulfide-isomerase
MRLLPVSLLFTLFASVVIAEAPEQPLRVADVPGEISPASEESVDEGPQSTVFNGVEVPPLTVLDGENFNTTVKDGYWFVKHHSWAALFPC